MEGAYDDWSNYNAVVFNMDDDRGDIGNSGNSYNEVFSIEEFSVKNQWWCDGCSWEDADLDGAYDPLTSYKDSSSGRICISLSK